MRLEAGVVKRCSVDVVNAPDSGVFENEEARYFHLVVVTCLQRHEQSRDTSNSETSHTQDAHVRGGHVSTTF